MKNYKERQSVFATLSAVVLASGLTLSCGGGGGGGNPPPPPAQQTFLLGKSNSTGAQASTGSWNGNLSFDGRYSIVMSDTPLTDDASAGINVYVHDHDTDFLVLMSRPDLSSPDFFANGDSWRGLIDQSGRFVFFLSYADNLIVEGLNWADNNGLEDVYVHDRDYDGNGILDEACPTCTKVERVSVDALGFELVDPLTGPGVGIGISNYSISADGRQVAFFSACPAREPGFCYGMLPNDVYFSEEHGALYVHDRDADNDGWYDEHNELGATTTVFVNSTVLDTFPKVLAPVELDSLAMDFYGRQLLYSIQTPDIDPVFDDGAFYQVYARDRDPLNTGIYDILVSDNLLSISEITGFSGYGDSYAPTTDDYGQFAAWTSAADDLDDQDFAFGIIDIVTYDRDYDLNGVYDEFTFLGGTLTGMVSLTQFGNDLNDHSIFPSMSGDARYMTFQSAASNIGDNSSNTPGYFGTYKHFYIDRDTDGDNEFDEFFFDDEVFTAWVEKTNSGFSSADVPVANFVQPTSAVSVGGWEVVHSSSWTHLLAPSFTSDFNGGTPDAFKRIFYYWW